MDSFILRALAAGVGLAAFMGPLGAFVVWRRMAYFGDTLAHSALLGVAIGFLIGVNVNVGIIGTCVAIALLLVWLRHRQRLAEDTLLGILAHSSLSLGLIAIAFLETLRIDLVSYLFGDILAVTSTDIFWILAGGAAALGMLAFLWRPLLSITVHEELARVEGVPVVRTHLVFMLLIATIIALAMKVVGILLVTSLLILPAATARRFSRTPEQMAALSSMVGVLAVAVGLGASFVWNLPSGPAIVSTLAVMFALTSMVPAQKPWAS